MPIFHSKTTNPCPVNFGLTEASARVIMSPHASERAIAYTSNIINRINNRIFDDFVGKVIRDPTAWTLELAAQTAFGRTLAQNQLIITDVTCSHSIKSPKEILLTIEIGCNQVSTYTFA